MAETDSSYADFTEQLGKGIVEQIERVQDTQVNALTSIREAIERFAPPLANLDYSIPRAIGAANFALAEQLLAAHKSYTLGLLESIIPKKSEDNPA